MPKSDSAEPAAMQRMASILQGLWLGQAVAVAAELGVADALQDGPQSAARLAERLDCNADALFRLLRALCGEGVFEFCVATRRFKLNALARTIARDNPPNLWPLASYAGVEAHAALSGLGDAVRSGRSDLSRHLGAGLFDHFDRNPDRGQVFEQLMKMRYRRENAAFLDAVTLPEVATIADIGGSSGDFLGQVLERYPNSQGLLFDRPEVLKLLDRSRFLKQIVERIECKPGDFFKTIDVSADVYLMRHVIHDWDDAQALRILKNCKAAMTPTSRLLVIEGLVTDDNQPSDMKWRDLTMLILFNGRERTLTEYRQLFDKAGLRLADVTTAEDGLTVFDLRTELRN